MLPPLDPPLPPTHPINPQIQNRTYVMLPPPTPPGAALQLYLTLASAVSAHVRSRVPGHGRACVINEIGTPDPN